MPASPVYQIRLRPRERKTIEDYVKRGELESVADFVHEAVSHHLRYLEERDFRLFIQSEEGQARMRSIAELEVGEENKNP